jgi:two-component system chemotaxis response regulator CheB
MAGPNIIVIGASAGGYEPLKTIVAGLPKDLDASIFVVWHMSPDVRGILPQVFNKFDRMHAAHAVDCEAIVPGRIYVAPPDHHLLLEEGQVRVTRGPKENRFRPAVDPLFRSAAYFYRNNVVGVILSGALDDGTSGLWTVKRRGGIAVVQSPLDADVPSMPDNALREVDVDHIVPAAEMPQLFVRLVTEKNGGRPVATTNDDEDVSLHREIKIAAEDTALDRGIMDLGELSPFTCPECHGVLARIKDGNLSRFRCHTGHAFSPDTLLSAMTEEVESRLWDAIRGLDETIMMLNNVGDHFAEHDQPRLAGKYFHKAKDARERSDKIREAIFSHEELTNETIREEAAIEYVVAEGETSSVGDRSN